MKLRLWDRVLATLYVVLSLALCVCVALRSLGVDLIGGFYERLTFATSYWYLIYFGFLLIIVLLGVFVLRLLFARRPRRTSFVTVDSGDNGKVIISMEALEQMVRQSITNDDGISDMKIGVEGHEDSISVLVELAVQGGVHLPTVTLNLQRDIRRYVEVNCGVAVRDVTVKVGSVLAPEGRSASGATEKKREAPWKRRKAKPVSEPEAIELAEAAGESSAEAEAEAAGLTAVQVIAEEETEAAAIVSAQEEEFVGESEPIEESPAPDATPAESFAQDATETTVEPKPEGEIAEDPDTEEAEERRWQRSWVNAWRSRAEGSADAEEPGPEEPELESEEQTAAEPAAPAASEEAAEEPAPEENPAPVAEAQEQTDDSAEASSEETMREDDEDDIYD